MQNEPRQRRLFRRFDEFEIKELRKTATADRNAVAAHPDLAALCGELEGLGFSLFIVFSMLFARFIGDYRPSPRVRAAPTFILAAVIIIGGIFTSTETAAVGLAVALILTGPVLRTMTWAKLREAVMESMVTTVAILISGRIPAVLVQWRSSHAVRSFFVRNANRASASAIKSSSPSWRIRCLSSSGIGPATH